MKKKGLIVATIVMVLVLAVSLTTATYAWFTNEGAATVEAISFGVEAASDLVIGVSKTNAWVASPQWSSYVSDNTLYDPDGDPDKWTGDTDGLGLAVNTDLNIANMTKAVYSFSGVTDDPKTGTPTGYTKGDGTAVAQGLDRTKAILKASGTGDKTTTNSQEFAIANVDYLDIVFAVAASKTDVLSFGCLISIDNTSNISSLGMNAAIHVVYSTDGSAYTELDVYGNATAGDPISLMTAPTVPTATIGTGNPVSYASSVEYAKGDGQVWIPLRNATASNDYAATGAAGIVQLHLIIYICGPDSD